MYTLSAFLPFFLTISLIITLGYSSAPLDDQDIAASSSKLRKVKGDVSNSQESPVVNGAYIVRLTDKTSAATVKSTAATTVASMQTLKKLLISNGTIPIASNDVVINVQPEHIFTNCIKGFVIQGIHDTMYSSLLQITGVIRVEADRITSIEDSMDNKSESTTKEDEIEIQQQVTPWGVSRVWDRTNPPPGPFTGIAFILSTGISDDTQDLNIDADLSENFASGGDWPYWRDLHGEGTHVAGTIAAINNNIGVVGVAPGTTVVAVRVLDAQGNGLLSNAISGVEYAYSKAKKGDVVFLGFGFRYDTVEYGSFILNAAVQKTASQGVRFAIKAGNSLPSPGVSRDSEDYTPASASGTNIFTVAAYRVSGDFWAESFTGDVVNAVGPGVSIRSLGRSFGSRSTRSGTSMAAAHIAGLLLAGKMIDDGNIYGWDGNPYPKKKYGGPITPPPPTKENLFSVLLRTDRWPRESAFTLTKISPGPPTLIASRGDGDFMREKKYECSIALPKGMYQFI